MRGRKWIVAGVSGALVLLCAAGGAWGQAPGSGQPAAIVNGEAIPMAELEAMLKQAGPMPVAVPEAVRKQQQRFALDALINEALLRQFLKQNAPVIDPKELQAHLHDLAAGLKMQNKTLADFCRDMNQTEEQVKANALATLQWNAYARQRISDPDIEKYYQEHKDMFDKVLVRVSEIMLRIAPQGGDAERARAKTQLMELRARLEQSKELSKDFAEAARQFSQGPTKNEGGDLDWFPHVKGILPENILRTAFALQRMQMSDPIDTEMGVHLLLLTDRKAGQPSDFAKIKEEVRQLCIEEMQQTVLQQLRQDAQTQGRVKVLLP